MRALVFALAATLVAMLVTTDARPVAAEPFARVRTPDLATSTMFPTHHMDGRLWARHADGAWAKGTGRWRDASIAMAEYARVHRAILAASSVEDDDASGERAARSRPTNAREPRFVVWRGRHLAGCPFPRRLRAAASALALALVTDRAFVIDDPVLEKLLDLDASDAFPMDVKEDPTKIRDDVLEMKLTSGSRKEEGGNDDASPTLPCGGVAGMHASTSRVHRFIADEAVDWTKALVEDPDASDRLRRNGLGINAAEVAGTFTTFLLRPRHVPIRISSEEDVPYAVGDHPASDVRRVSGRRVIGVHVSEDDLEYRRDRAEDEEDAGESEVLGSIPTPDDDPAGTLREWTSSCVSTLSGRDERRNRDDRRTRDERGGSPSLLSSTLAALFGSRGRNREVTGSNPGRDELDTDPIVVAAFEDNSFSARGAGTVRTWFNERVSRLGFHDEDGKKHKTRSEKESDKAPDEASDEGQLADLLALTAGCDELVVTGPDGDLGGVAAAVFGAVTGRVARKPGDSCVALDLSHDLDLGVGRRGELETAAVLARATGRGVVAARVVNEGGSAVC